MPADPEYLRQHYASFSDEGLMSIDRAKLTEVAQQYYDEELARRGLAYPRMRRRLHLTKEPKLRAMRKLRFGPWISGKPLSLPVSRPCSAS
jgi:hypothetical protein